MSFYIFSFISMSSKCQRCRW